MKNNKRQKDTRSLVKDIFIAHPEWNARQIYDRYLILIGDTNKAVTLNAVQKHVEVLRGNYNKMLESGLDETWYLHHTLDMSAEAIAHVLEVKKVMPEWMVLPPSLSEASPRHYVIMEGKKLTALPRRMTMREARWVERLYAVKSLKKTVVLSKAVCVYTLLERLSKLLDTPLDTSEADEIIAGTKNVENALECYFRRLPNHETWLELIKDSVNIQQTKKEGEK